VYIGSGVEQTYTGTGAVQGYRVAGLVQSYMATSIVHVCRITGVSQGLGVHKGVLWYMSTAGFQVYYRGTGVRQLYMSTGV